MFYVYDFCDGNGRTGVGEYWDVLGVDKPIFSSVINYIHENRWFPISKFN